MIKDDLYTRLASGAAILGLCLAGSLRADEPVFDKDVKPLLENYCYDCHGDGMEKGNVALDGFKTHQEMLADREVWHKVLKNLRAELMPPAKKDQPTAEEKERIAEWIKGAVFKIDPENPDPGRVTVRRLNRVEYRNTIRDLMGVDFNTMEEFPPDDTGYGFDNIGDVLTVSPLLLEKYLQAAGKIVSEAVPKVARVVRERTFSARDFRGEGKSNGESMSFYEEAKVATRMKIEQAGDYKVDVAINVNGAFDFDPARCEFAFYVDGKEKFREEFKWEDNKRFEFSFDEEWEAGERKFAFELKPLVPEDQKKTHVNMRISSVQVQGPMEEKHWAKTKNYDRFFPREAPPEKPEERRDYAKEILERFATKAFRRPVESGLLERLVELAEATYQDENKTFEEGVAQAMIAVLASPRFLFRIEEPLSNQGKFALLDEYSIASRLSYFLWSTMPDEELFQLARKGELRKNLDTQVKRMLADERSEEFVENFVGQWLQVRDVQGIAINERAVFAREVDPADIPEDRQERRRFFRRLETPDLDRDLRRAMRLETESFFKYIMKEDRSLVELLDSDYTFLNERLAEHYGIEGVEGDEMRRVELPEESPRGGLITQASMLVVSSNPTRTSPVKRGLYILENLLGSPPPPPPPETPDLEEAEEKFKDREPTQREALALHLSNNLCKSCHLRMDPLGFGLENFNALGMWREMERGQPIEPKGKLITGEEFEDVRELKQILAEEREVDFYRCLTEKMLTYALGRGLEYYDVEAVDQIVEQLKKENGRFSALLMGIVNSAPFQKQRTLSGVAAGEPIENVNLIARTEP